MNAIRIPESNFRTSGPSSPLGEKLDVEMDALCILSGLRVSSMYSSLENQILLAVARKLTASREILLWMIPSEAPKALQAPECSDLLGLMRASCWISAQH